jgi:preprotein translocase subunit YajC
MGFLILIIGLLLLLWVLVVRPQRRRQLQQLQMQDEVDVGDEVITAGGMHGYVRQLDESVLTLEIAPEVRVRVDRRAIAGKVRPAEDEPEAAEEREERPRVEQAES